MIGFAMTGSFCNFETAFGVLERLALTHEVLPVFSFNAASLDTRFGRAAEHIERAERICKHTVVRTLPDAEPLGPRIKLDALVICPCTGNTLAKLSHGIYDTPVTLAAKAHLRTGKPLVIALASNDAMSANFENVARMNARKHVFFVPFGEDAPFAKPYSLVCDFSKTEAALEAAMNGRQLQPMLF